MRIIKETMTSIINKYAHVMLDFIINLLEESLHILLSPQSGEVKLNNDSSHSIVLNDVVSYSL